MILGYLAGIPMSLCILILYITASVTHPSLASIGNVRRVDYPHHPNHWKYWQQQGLALDVWVNSSEMFSHINSNSSIGYSTAFQAALYQLQDDCTLMHFPTHHLGNVIWNGIESLTKFTMYHIYYLLFIHLAVLILLQRWHNLCWTNPHGLFLSPYYALQAY